MPTKRRQFTRNKRVLKQPYRRQIGNKSGNNRGKITKKPQDEAIILSKQKESKESPNIYQSITERADFLHRHIVSSFSLPKTFFTIFWVVLVGLTLWQAVSLTKQLLFAGEVLKERITISKELQLWENISQKYPTYRDADVQVAILAYRLGDMPTAQTYVNKALQLDPNYDPAIKLSQSLP